MIETPVPPSARGIPELSAWVRGRLAHYLQREPEQIDIDESLFGYGLDSVYALTLCGDIDDEFGIEVDPTLAWDYPTIQAIAGYLADRLAGATVNPASAPTPGPAAVE